MAFNQSVTEELTADQKWIAVRSWLGTGSINLFGVPFAGKDTQCRELGRRLNAPVLSGGDILRKRDDLPHDVREIMNRGELIPIEDYLRIVTPYLAQDEFKGAPLVLSAVGRFLGEEQGVMQATAAAGHALKLVILLDLEEEVVWERWRGSLKLLDRGARADDGLEALKVRLQEFHHKTQPVIDFYQQHGLLAVVDGSAAPKVVETSVLDALYRRAQEQVSLG